MRLPQWAVRGLLAWYDRVTMRDCNQIIGPADDVYMLRWYVIPRNRFFNIYMHYFCRSDDDRALHDHPWWNISILLRGNYIEEVPADPAHPEGERTGLKRRTGQVVFRRAEATHRVALYRTGRMAKTGRHEELPVKTLFITGPKLREWGFWCLQGWKHWRLYSRPRPDGLGTETGEGCAEFDRGGQPSLWFERAYDSRLWTGRP